MVYFLSKILPLALLPLGCGLISLLVGIVARRRWPVFISAILLWFFSLGLVGQTLWRLVEAPWQRRAAIEAPQADAIVVLSGGRSPAPGPARLSEWQDSDRFFAGLHLFRAGKASRLLFTGGASHFRPGQRLEGQEYIEEAVFLGIPIEAMATTPPVITAEEAIAIRRLLDSMQPTNSVIPRRILLVTSAYHRRAQRLFERQV